MEKRIFSFGVPHSVHKSLFSNPPEGYKFISPKTNKYTKAWDSNLRKKIRNFSFVKKIWESSKKFHNPVKKRYQDLNEMDNEDEVKSSDFVFSGEILPTKKPYWIEIEHIRQLMGWDIRLLFENKEWISKKLQEENCKLVTSYTEAGIKSLLDNLPESEKFKDKCHFVHNAIPSIDYNRNFKKEEITFIFLGSAALPYDFYMKGGNIVIEAFKIVREHYKNTKLVIKPWAPDKIKKKYGGVKGMTFQSFSSDEEFASILKEADILVSPNHNTPAKVFLDAMNYSMPIITTDLWANREIVQDNYNGLLISKSNQIPYFVGNNIPNSRSKEFDEAIQITDKKMIQDIAEKMIELLKDQSLREKLGRNGKKEIESGEFSIKKRNEKYKKLLDKNFKE